MFQGLERWECRALGSIYGGSISSPIIPDDAGYLDFFTKVPEWVEAGAEQVGVLIEDEIRNLMSKAPMHVFSNLLHVDPHFDFEAAMAPVPRAIRVALRKALPPTTLKSGGAEGHLVDDDNDGA
ncbi:hypothetical protein D1007_04468 [Hordeum vulgare]|nr:hypothetical protein D1007_04468 [Hordeum vulgare]